MYILRFIKTRFNASPVFKPPFMQTIPLTMHRLWYILSLIYFTLEILYILVFIICLHCQGPPVIEIRLGCWFYSKFFVYVFLNHNVLCQIYISVWYILKQLLPVNFHLLKTHSPSNFQQKVPCRAQNRHLHGKMESKSRATTPLGCDRI